MVFAETEDHKVTDTSCHAHTGLSAIVRSSRFHRTRSHCGLLFRSMRRYPTSPAFCSPKVAEGKARNDVNIFSQIIH
jgi:hypothetical protein